MRMWVATVIEIQPMPHYLKAIICACAIDLQYMCNGLKSCHSKIAM